MFRRRAALTFSGSLTPYEKTFVHVNITYFASTLHHIEEWGFDTGRHSIEKKRMIVVRMFCYLQRYVVQQLSQYTSMMICMFLDYYSQHQRQRQRSNPLPLCSTHALSQELCDGIDGNPWGLQNRSFFHHISGISLSSELRRWGLLFNSISFHYNYSNIARVYACDTY